MRGRKRGIYGSHSQKKTPGKGQPYWIFVNHRGRRTSRKVGSLAAARKVAVKIEAALKLGDLNLDEQKAPTFAEYAEKFLAGYVAANLKETTLQGYTSDIRRYLIPHFGNMPLDAITRQDVKAFLIGLQTRQVETRGKKRRLAVATVRNLKAVLCKVFSEALDDEIISANPAAKTGKHIKNTGRKSVPEPLSASESALLAQTIEKYYPKAFPLFLTLMRTGMRLGEALALQPGDLDFNSRFITVRRSTTRGIVSTPKSKKSRRVDMSMQLVEVLKRHLHQRDKDLLRLGAIESTPWLFYGENGGPMVPHDIRRKVFLKALKKAGLRHVRIHDLRHTYATLRIAAGHNIADVQKQLGHSSIKITVDTYNHWLPGASKAQVDELDSLHPSAPSPHPERQPTLKAV